MYRGKVKVTLENYSDLFKEYSLDIRDEVRSMLLDGLDLSEWVELCKNDPFRLMQVRLAVKEGLSSEFLAIPYGSALYGVRGLSSKGYDLSGLLPYIDSGFSESQWSYIISWVKAGKLNADTHLERLPSSMWSYVDKGFACGLPMGVFMDGKVRSETFMYAMLVLMSKGYSTSKYLRGVWRDEVIEKLAEYSSRSWFVMVHDSVVPTISYSFLDNLGKLAGKGIPLGKYLQHLDGVYLYQDYHLSFIAKAAANNLDYSRLDDSNLRFFECESIYKELESESLKKFRGRL